MAKAAYQSARGGLAGWDFHALWALSQALRLLDTKDTVVSMSAEGIRGNKAWCSQWVSNRRVTHRELQSFDARLFQNLFGSIDCLRLAGGGRVKRVAG
jgi:histidine ammonia-lyase